MIFKPKHNFFADVAVIPSIAFPLAADIIHYAKQNWFT